MKIVWIDRLLIGAFATGLWLICGLLLLGNSPAAADEEFGFVTKFSVYNIAGIDRHIKTTVESCIVGEDGRIHCGSGHRDNGIN
ncbi:MAG: hypothetical protein MI725_13270 [Pirellulales bacterium]|nr:hypothetical protein [Pirellulales bacterium]